MFSTGLRSGELARQFKVVMWWRCSHSLVLPLTWIVILLKYQISLWISPTEAKKTMFQSKLVLSRVHLFRNEEQFDSSSRTDGCPRLSPPPLKLRFEIKSFSFFRSCQWLRNPSGPSNFFSSDHTIWNRGNSRRYDTRTPLPLTSRCVCFDVQKEVDFDDSRQ